jgi:hypothetical protein
VTFISLFFFLQRDELGALVSLEMGKIRTEGVGEVQEFVDIVSAWVQRLPPARTRTGLLRLLGRLLIRSAIMRLGFRG